MIEFFLHCALTSIILFVPTALVAAVVEDSPLGGVVAAFGILFLAGVVLFPVFALLCKVWGL